MNDDCTATLALPLPSSRIPLIILGSDQIMLVPLSPLHFTSDTFPVIFANFVPSLVPCPSSLFPQNTDLESFPIWELPKLTRRGDPGKTALRSVPPRLQRPTFSSLIFFPDSLPPSFQPLTNPAPEIIAVP